MKIYKHDRYQDKILLAYPSCDHILGIPFHYSLDKNVWVRSGIGMAIPYYTQEQLSKMECIGDTEIDWIFIIDPNFFDASCLVKLEQLN